MEPTQINDFVHNFFELLNQKDFDSLMELLSPGVVFHFPGTVPLRGPKKATQLMRIVCRKYPDLTFKIEDIIVQDNKIAVIWENSGKDTKDKLYLNQGVTIMEIEKGKVCYLSDFFKDTSFI
jgi:ketosteroid isomerase-like protein